jgi:hypothetical protein
MRDNRSKTQYAHWSQWLAHVGGHQNLPSGGYEVSALAITEIGQLCQSSGY